MGLRFQSKADEARYLAVLLKAAAASGGKFDVYTHDTMPQRWHFAHNERIAPIYVVPRMGYALTNRIENGAGMCLNIELCLPMMNCGRFSSGKSIQERIWSSFVPRETLSYRVHVSRNRADQTPRSQPTFQGTK